MELSLEHDVQCESRNRTYWVRVTISLEGGTATYLTCAAKQYIADKYNPTGKEVNEGHVENWTRDMLEDIRNSTETFQNGEVYYKVYSLSSDGQDHGKIFLQTLAP